MMSVHSAHAGQPFIVNVFLWEAMMIVMMAPTVTPWVLAFQRFTIERLDGFRRLQSIAGFAAGYAAVWLAYSVCAAAVQSLLDLTPLRGGILLAAGVFQLLPLKRACLVHCRNPFSYLLARWKDKSPSGFRIGLGHGAYCVVCCGALMATALALGIMNLWWMAALTVAVFIEQVVPHGAWVRVPFGVALIAAAAYSFVSGETYL